MSDFIRKYKYPVIVDYSNDIDYRVRSYKRPAFILVTDHDKDLDYKKFSSFCEQYKHKIICAISLKKNFGDHEHIDYLKSYIKIIEWEGERIKKFNLDTVRSIEMKQAYKDWENGNLEHYIVSEKIPKLITNSDVKTIVGDNFDEIITNDLKNDAFLHLYSPDHKFLEDHKNEFKSLSFSLRGKGVKLYEMNKDRNHHHKIVTDKPSTVFFIRKSDNKVFEYEDNNFTAIFLLRFYEKIKKEEEEEEFEKFVEYDL